MSLRVVYSRETKYDIKGFTSPVELPYISCKNLAEVEHIRHYLQESCKYLTFNTKPVRFCQIRHCLQIQTFLARFLQAQTTIATFLDSWKCLQRVPGVLIQTLCAVVDEVFETQSVVEHLLELLEREFVQLNAGTHCQQEKNCVGDILDHIPHQRHFDPASYKFTWNSCHVD